MTSHLGIMVLFAAAVAVVFGALQREDVREQVRFGAKVFALLVLGAYALGWVMHFAF